MSKVHVNAMKFYQRMMKVLSESDKDGVPVNDDDNETEEAERELLDDKVFRLPN